jgi:hypothetical protein
VLRAAGKQSIQLQPELEQHRYNLLTKVTLSRSRTELVTVYKFSQELKVKIRERRSGVYVTQDFTENTDITGNATVWNAEECLAYYVL